MKKFLFLLFLCICSLESAEMAVTYTFSSGRLGDNLLSYAHAKWISYRFDIPLLYQPFPYSDRLVLHDIEPLYCQESVARFKKSVTLGYGEQVDKRDPLPVLYTLPYFGEGAYERSLNPGWPYVKVDWKDQGFRALLKKVIRPKTPLPKWDLPTDRIAVAVHVRRGGGFDSPHAQNFEPLRFPPDAFYIDQIKRLYDQFQASPLYVFIFTDDPHPQTIVERFQEELKGLPISFDYRKTNNRHDANVLEDFFAMTQFHCLIRPESNYSRMASLISDFTIEIYPTHFTWIHDRPHIDDCQVNTRGEG